MTIILRYFREFGSFRGQLRKSGWLSQNSIRSILSETMSATMSATFSSADNLSIVGDLSPNCRKNDEVIACSAAVLVCASAYLVKFYERQHTVWVKRYLQKRSQYGVFNTLLPELATATDESVRYVINYVTASSINRFSPERCRKIHQLSTTDALCSSR